LDRDTIDFQIEEMAKWNYQRFSVLSVATQGQKWTEMVYGWGRALL